METTDSKTETNTTYIIIERITMNSFKQNLNNETLASTGRATLEAAATTASLAVLAGKSLAAAWHTTTLGNAARDQDLGATLRLEGTTKEVLTDGLDNFTGYFTPATAAEKDQDLA